MKKKYKKYIIACSSKSLPPVRRMHVKSRSPEEFSRRELLVLSMALMNIREGREMSFLVGKASPRVIRCAKRIAKMPAEEQREEMKRINLLAIKA